MLYESCGDRIDLACRITDCVWSQDLQGLVQLCELEVSYNCEAHVNAATAFQERFT